MVALESQNNKFPSGVTYKKQSNNKKLEIFKITFNKNLTINDDLQILFMKFTYKNNFLFLFVLCF